MRAALAPTSLLPTRDTERTSTRAIPDAGITRITTSSLNPHQPVIAVASMRPSSRSAATISHPISRAARSACPYAESGVMASITGCTSWYASLCCRAMESPS
jgi:hypothetical protein